MSELLSSLFRPVETAIAWLLASLHDLAATAGWGAGTAWLAALIGLVIVVRGALVPVTIRQVRLAHAAARAPTPRACADSSPRVERSAPNTASHSV